MKYKMIMTIATALTAVVVASVGLAAATNSPWDWAPDTSPVGIQQHDRDRISRPEDAGSEGPSGNAASENALQSRSCVAAGTPSQSRAASGTPAAAGTTGLVRAQERASDQAQPVLARVRERIGEQDPGCESSRARTRTCDDEIPPVRAEECPQEQQRSHEGASGGQGESGEGAQGAGSVE
jgi:hypothetical protein